jgi:adenosylcobinamide-GDP ribazoletransferase
MSVNLLIRGPDTLHAMAFDDGPRFAFGTLTILRVRVTRWDRAAARAGMLCAPLVGLVVGAVAAFVGGLLLLLGASTLLAAVATAAVPAALTRGLHLDGLADTADGLGSGKPAEDALRIMKQSDIGPFGVLSLLFVILGQVAALSSLYAFSWALGAVAITLASAVGRAAMTLACRPGIPPARPDGLGAAVAGAVPVRTAWGTAAVVVLLGAACGTAFGPWGALQFAASAVAGLAAAELLLRRCRARFGGVTGDVFGALCESAVIATLVVASLG